MDHDEFCRISFMLLALIIFVYRWRAIKFENIMTKALGEMAGEIVAIKKNRG